MPALDGRFRARTPAATVDAADDRQQSLPIERTFARTRRIASAKASYLMIAGFFRRATVRRPRNRLAQKHARLLWQSPAASRPSSYGRQGKVRLLRPSEPFRRFAREVAGDRGELCPELSAARPGQAPPARAPARSRRFRRSSPRAASVMLMEILRRSLSITSVRTNPAAESRLTILVTVGGWMRQSGRSLPHRHRPCWSSSFNSASWPG